MLEPCWWYLTDGSHSAANLGFVEHRFRAIQIRSKAGSWAMSWRVPWEGSHALKRRGVKRRKNCQQRLCVNSGRNSTRTRSGEDRAPVRVPCLTYRYSLTSSAYFSLYSMREALLLMVPRNCSWQIAIVGNDKVGGDAVACVVCPSIYQNRMKNAFVLLLMFGPYFQSLNL